MATTGENIASLRKALGYTQAKLAQAAGISTSAVAMYETNRRQPDDATMLLLASALGADVSALTGSASEAVKPLNSQSSKSAPTGAPTAPKSSKKSSVVKVSAAANKAIPAIEPFSPEPAAQAATATADAAPNPHAQTPAHKPDAGWTNLALSRDEARFILFMRMHPDTLPFLQEFMNVDAQKRKQIEKAWRLIQAFQA
ncbi:helix-turn-helix domain-containing protein [Alicyclobacillus fastidiosus]|uniref:Helix-turn-helix domain-containing protein n=1 Tax=Alicyclobacillus fastidiosus TaxID=392011 RepID=A0ABY6ZIX0_9BACL|nr:helix-turn-helix transcriptional regulator [Alicyclobacillus fastidiosus]WAH42874.1 helix-turn-helix domain-containing protein [Alicyclobacillus fastidiosus]GMA64813.1 hypothetical protein GCM10025859_52530 [Alicyclobacillus fastidiosus]